MELEITSITIRQLNIFLNNSVASSYSIKENNSSQTKEGVKLSFFNNIVDIYDTVLLQTYLNRDQ